MYISNGLVAFYPLIHSISPTTHSKRGIVLLASVVLVLASDLLGVIACAEGDKTVVEAPPQARYRIGVLEHRRQPFVFIFHSVLSR